MEFPVFLRLGPLAVHPHPVFEVLGYLLGAWCYLRLRERGGDHLPDAARSSVLAAAAVGAAVGSKLMYWLADPGLTVEHWLDPVHLMGGKSIVGGLAGGLIAVEWVKRRIGVTWATGDLFAVPLAIGIAVGRIGCFLSGLEDETYGLPAALPWGVDLGDGLSRHPVQLYEIACLLLLVPVLLWLMRRPHPEGAVFKAFMVAYFGFRFLLEFLKPGVHFAGLNPIQWVCLGVLAYYGSLAVRQRRWQAGAARG